MGCMVYALTALAAFIVQIFADMTLEEAGVLFIVGLMTLGVTWMGLQWPGSWETSSSWVFFLVVPFPPFLVSHSFV